MHNETGDSFLPTEATNDVAAPALERRARWLLALLAVLLVGAVVYLMYARGVFEPTQTLVLIADDAEGVTVGMDLTFSGFPIGRVRRIALGEDGTARIVVDIARRDARWLRENSVFTLERGLLGGTRLRAYTGVLEGPLLPDGAQRRVLHGDALADLPRMVNAARELLDQLKAMTDAQAPLNISLHEMQRLLERANSADGLLGVLVGNKQDRARISAMLDDARRLLLRLQAVTNRADGLLQRTDERLLGPQGLTDEVQASVRQARELLIGLQATLQNVDAVLMRAHAIATDVKGATQDLDVLRSEVEETLRRVDSMILDIQRRWPFARDPEVSLP